MDVIKNELEITQKNLNFMLLLEKPNIRFLETEALRMTKEIEDLVNQIKPALKISTQTEFKKLSSSLNDKIFDSRLRIFVSLAIMKECLDQIGVRDIPPELTPF